MQATLSYNRRVPYNLCFPGGVLGFMEGFGFAALRSLCSNMVEVSEQGKCVIISEKGPSDMCSQQRDRLVHSCS